MIRKGIPSLIKPIHFIREADDQLIISLLAKSWGFRLAAAGVWIMALWTMILWAVSLS
jgi:hypothetical protein